MNSTAQGAGIRALALALTFVLPVVGLAGCDAITGSSDSDSTQGTWVLVEGNQTTFVEVTVSTIIVYDGRLDSCFERAVYDIIHQDGDTYTLSGPVATEVAIFTITRQGDDLVIDDQGQRRTFAASDQDLAQLDLCGVDAGGGADPSIDCSTLPTISLGQTVVGELSVGDDMNSGRYYDLYGLTLTSQIQVTIAAASNAVDTYLYLYESDGTFVTKNDDGGTGPNSSMMPTLDAGCYRIELTSYFSGETGSYTLSVN